MARFGYILKDQSRIFYIFLQENSISATKLWIFSLCINLHSNLLLVKSVFHLTRGHDQKKSLERWKNVERKIYQDLYTGEGFASNTFEIFGHLPSAYQPQVGPQTRKVLPPKPSPIPHAPPLPT